MTHLFDTNAWLRSMGRLGELNAATQQLLFDNTHAPFAVSAISVWEIGLKLRKRPGHLDLGLPFQQWLTLASLPHHIRILPIDDRIALLSNELPGVFHEDPADRLIVATALIHNLIILTSDEKILAYTHVQSHDTR